MLPALPWSLIDKCDIVPPNKRTLATTVVFGIGASTLMTMFLLPAILKLTLRREQRGGPVG
jgi:hypothetical protein